ncbi:MAG: 3-dehydroquinate synthase [Gammaproteobacteria bacterium]|nr:3-dehydroquinate synthase [Gammaproteobacteria bacterium]
MKTLTVDLGARSYPIYIGRQLLANPDLLLPHIHGHQVMVVTNETIAPLYLNKVQQHLGNLEHKSVILPDGEQYKTLDTVNQIFDSLLTNRFNRNATLIALGGGVIGDITGFAAAAYQRGIHFIQIPTTLLAQVDSSVGGKTGVNHKLGKNMIGAFHQPDCVIADTDTLNTLDDRQLSAGIAEVIKYGLISDPEFLTWLESKIPDLLSRDPETLAYAIETSCMNKASVVAADERESGQRALLNLGHTFGHAIETGIGYGNWLHGEAVAVGMYMAANLSERLHWISRDDVLRIEKILKLASLPVFPPEEMDNDKFLNLMAVDKKVVNKRLRLVLLKELGKAIVTEDFERSVLETMLSEIKREPLKDQCA